MEGTAPVDDGAPDFGAIVATVEVPGGATLLLDTDGLVERPESDLDAGVDRLDPPATGLAHLPLEDCDQLLDRLVDRRPSDAGPNRVPA